jgi:predicted lipid-binding transport protein (Tim44 family)
MSPDIILYAIIAVILLARLWSLFGQRNDADQQRSNPFAMPAPAKRDDRPAPYTAPTNAAPQLEGAVRQVLPFVLPPTSLAGGLEQVQTIYPAFDEKQFLQNARVTFTQVVEAFAKGDLAGIEKHLGSSVLAQFKAAIDARRIAKQTLECRIVAIPEVEVTAARIDGKKAFLTTRIISEQITALRDAGGAIMGGDETQREQITDIWIFMRDASTTEANWTLIETKS